MKTTRKQRLIPNGIPRYIRIYDNGGKTVDRYTCCYTGKYRGSRSGKMGLAWFQYVGMSSNPFDPQGFGQHGESQNQIDVNKWGFAPAIGRKNHLGTRIHFKDLPPDCRRLVLKDYREIWSL